LGLLVFTLLLQPLDSPSGPGLLGNDVNSLGRMGKEKPTLVGGRKRATLLSFLGLGCIAFCHALYNCGYSYPCGK